MIESQSEKCLDQHESNISVGVHVGSSLIKVKNTHLMNNNQLVAEILCWRSSYGVYFARMLEKTDRVITATHCIVLWQDRRWLTDFTECPHPVWYSVVRMETEVRHIQRQVSTCSVEVHIVSHSRTCSPQVWRCVSRYMSGCPHCCEKGIAIVCWSCD